MRWSENPGRCGIWVSKVTRWYINVRRYVLPPVIYTATQCAWIGKNHNIRTIRRIAITLIVVYKNAGFGTWVPRPARVENVPVFVLPEYHSWMDPFYNLDDDFVPLRGARERMRTE
jgi:hypothetical protein